MRPAEGWKKDRSGVQLQEPLRLRLAPTHELCQSRTPHGGYEGDMVGEYPSTRRGWRC